MFFLEEVKEEDENGKSFQRIKLRVMENNGLLGYFYREELGQKNLVIYV